MKITQVHYRDMDGDLLWKDEIVFRRLWGVGNNLVHDYKAYIVRHVAVVDGIQHVNIERWAQRYSTEYPRIESLDTMGTYLKPAP